MSDEPIHLIYPDPQLKTRRRAAMAIRELSEALVGHEVPDDLLGEISAWAASRAELARQGAVVERGEDYQARRYTDPKPPDHTELCTFTDRPISGLANPAAMNMSLRREGDESVGTVVFDRRFESSPGRVHGGMTAATFDDVMGYVNVIDGVAAYTLELNVKYIAGMPLHEPIEIRARTVARDHRRSTVTAEAHSADGTLVASGSAIFALIPPERFA